MSLFDWNPIPLQTITQDNQELRLNLQDYIKTDDEDIIPRIAFELESQTIGRLENNEFVQEFDINNLRLFPVTIKALYQDEVKYVRFNVRIMKYLHSNILNINPQIGQTNVQTNLTLTWYYENVLEEDLLYDVYFGDSQETKLRQTNLDIPSLEIKDLNKDTTYYWKVRVKDTYGNSVVSPLWHFSTQQSKYGEPKFILKNQLNQILLDDNGNIYSISNESFLNKYDISGNHIWSNDIRQGDL